jgi:hypothetical protein
MGRAEMIAHSFIIILYTRPLPPRTAGRARDLILARNIGEIFFYKEVKKKLIKKLKKNMVSGAITLSKK